MADNTFNAVALVEETTPFTTPSAALQKLRVISGTKLGRAVTRTEDKSYTGSRGKYKPRIAYSEGPIELVMPYVIGNDALPLEGLLGNDYSSLIDITATTIAFNGTTGAITAGSSLFGSLAVGDMIFVESTSNAGWVGPISAASGTSLTVPAAQLTTEAAGGSVRIRTKRLLAGSTSKAYTCQLWNTEIASKFEVGRGAVAQSMSLAFKADGEAEQKFTFLGLEPVTESSSVGSGTTAAPTNTHHVGLDVTQSWFLDAATFLFTALELSVDAKRSPRKVIGSAGPIGFNQGKHDVMVKLGLYADATSWEVLDEDRAQGTQLLWFATKDLEENRRCILLPAGTLQDVELSLGEDGSPLEFQNFTFKAHSDDLDGSTTTNYPFQIGIFEVPAE